MPTSLTELNQSECAAFVAALGYLFEHSPWVAEETWPQRPFASADALHAALCATMRAAPRERQLALICVHPDLAGRLAQQK
ncbi:MAG: 2-oxo-4-hydroxy-4-carboxy-5-ureidoimidazoline decarboxylase [Verrucomicrobiota bacterium]|nr:2-oxo-4-hydroxy-4-carboxy-5-ureidoimidazoline decarboxylase [Verrucomicrobiota bacterium]